MRLFFRLSSLLQHYFDLCSLLGMSWSLHAQDRRFRERAKVDLRRDQHVGLDRCAGDVPLGGTQQPSMMPLPLLLYTHRQCLNISRVDDVRAADALSPSCHKHTQM